MKVKRKEQLSWRQKALLMEASWKRFFICLVPYFRLLGSYSWLNLRYRELWGKYYWYKFSYKHLEKKLK